MLNLFGSQVAGPPRTDPILGGGWGVHTAEGPRSALGRKVVSVPSRLPVQRQVMGKLLILFHFSKLCDFSLQCLGNDSSGSAKQADVLGTKSMSSGNKEVVSCSLAS